MLLLQPIAAEEKSNMFTVVEGRDAEAYAVSDENLLEGLNVFNIVVGFDKNKMSHIFD